MSVFSASPQRFDAQGNPMMLAGCPNCGKGREWLSMIDFVGLKNAGHDPSGPCSRACALQIEYAKDLPPRGLR